MSPPRKSTHTGDGWKVTGVVHNVGDGRMTIDVAAAAGVQWPEAGKKAAPWKTERTTITIGAGERVPVTLRCAFRPEKLVVDPDARRTAVRRAGPARGGGPGIRARRGTARL